MNELLTCRTQLLKAFPLATMPTTKFPNFPSDSYFGATLAYGDCSDSLWLVGNQLEMRAIGRVVTDSLDYLICTAKARHKQPDGNLLVYSVSPPLPLHITLGWADGHFPVEAGQHLQSLIEQMPEFFHMNAVVARFAEPLDIEFEAIVYLKEKVSDARS